LARFDLALDQQEYEALTERVLGAVFEVSNTLGAGFLEKVYERALVRELGLRGIRTAVQAPLAVSYKGYAVGEYFVDILVEDRLMVELKRVERLANEHTAQCLNYLRVGAGRVPTGQFPAGQGGVAAYSSNKREWPRMNAD
jgi:GxxExxY protein